MWLPDRDLLVKYLQNKVAEFMAGDRRSPLHFVFQVYCRKN
ncbi:MAG: hypothetical protein R3Y53_00355 [Bacillota bacterium]